MKISKNQIITKIHLVIAVLVVVPVALMYGFQLKSPFQLHADTIDQHSFFKAVMGLYLGFAVFWILGVFKSHLLRAALISNTIFMWGLGLGRLLSWWIDGTPGYGYQFGTLAELFLGCYGLWVIINFSRFKDHDISN